MPHLTQRIVDRAAAKERDYFLWDDDPRGLGLRVYPSGQKVWLVRYSWNGKREYAKLGGMELSLEDARHFGADTLRKVRRGIDPKGAGGDATFREVAERYMREHVNVRLKPRTQQQYEMVLRRYLVPALGRLRMVSVRRQDVARLHQSLSDKPTLANQIVTVLHHIFKMADLWGYVPPGMNPTVGVTRYKQEAKERILTPDEFRRLGEALKQLDQEEADMVNLVLFTGMRKMEVATLRWWYVDRDAGVINLPDSKTGKKTIYLNEQAQEVLRRQWGNRSDNSDYVWPSVLSKNGHRDLGNLWEKVRKAAGLDDVRLHDLRHVFASVAVGTGQSLYVTGKLLGHKNAKTTERYAHMMANPMIEATTQVGAKLEELLGE